MNAATVAPKAYRYARFSHSRQADGMSLERQADVAAEWCAQRGMVLDDTLAAFVDAGVSASRGKNLVKGALSRFREAVAAKDVPPGSFLLVESVSRFSRLSPIDSKPILRELVEAGIRVVFFDPSVEVNAENIGGMQVGMIFDLMSYIANEYAATLGRYKLKAWERARETGKPATRMLPYWLTCEVVIGATGKRGRGPVEPHPLYGPLVQRIFRDYLAGSGKGQIAARLNDASKGPPIPPPQRVGGKAGAAFWRHGLIGRTLANRSVCGVFQHHKEVRARITLKSGIAAGLKIKREAVLAPVPGFYPRIISDELFAKAATLRAQNQAKAGSKIGSARGEVSHILARLASCPVCGKAMMRRNAGEGHRQAPRYVCSQAIAGKSGACQRVYVPVAIIERAIVDNAALITASAPIGDPDLQAQIEGIDMDIDVLQGQIDDGVTMTLEAGRNGEPISRAVNANLVQLEARVDALQAKRAALAQRAAGSSTNVIRNRVAALATVLDAYRLGMEQVSGVNATLYECFERVVIDYRSGELVMHWRHGPPPTTVRYYDSTGELKDLGPLK